MYRSAGAFLGGRGTLKVTGDIGGQDVPGTVHLLEATARLRRL